MVAQAITNDQPSRTSLTIGYRADTAALQAVADQLEQVIANGEPEQAKALLAILIADLHVNSRSEVLPTYRLSTPTVCAPSSSVEPVASKSNQDSCDGHKRLVSGLIDCINQDLQERLSRLVKKLADVRANGEVRVRPSCRQRSRRPGWVLSAIVQVLTDREEPMRAHDIHAAVEALVGESVARSSVRDALASNVAGPSRRFVRIGRGRYVLANGSSSSC